ncbi:concanavalin A-like lectin/glucanase domain-containing protein [Russula brevipes]|nr:concanavalin A-like lectin/glucanase domain-containing protein [Russula brevipes]
MRTGYAFLAALSLSLTRCASGTFLLEDQWIGSDFFRDWNWETSNDPTHGRVNYVSQAEAISKNLTYSVKNENGAKFIMRADDTSFVSPSARGRDSIRISSENAYDDAMFVLDLQHMPTGCATWPAFWTLSKAGPWPNGGEIDIIEGTSTLLNQATLHTTPGCTMPPDDQRPQAGSTANTNCDTSINFNAGCGVSFPKDVSSYGPAFNYKDGGHYVMLKSRNIGVQVWFWPRGSPRIPKDVLGGGSLTPDDVTWGRPAANFPMKQGSCDYDSHFNAHRMVFDLTFCGDWAGNAWFSSGCAGLGACDDFVNNNPSAFNEAYWEINSLRVYTPG